MRPDPPAPERRVPEGVPRWLWPPPGAEVRRVRLSERWSPTEGGATFEVLEGEPPEPMHLNALTWLLHDHEVGERPPAQPFAGEVLLEIARTALPSGRVGHSYALDGGPLGAPSGARARGLMLRYAAFVLGR
jgi:hypothetical protein